VLQQTRRTTAVDLGGYPSAAACNLTGMLPSIETYLSLLRAVDRDGLESRSLETWTFTTTSEVAGRCRMARQHATSLLRSLLHEGYVVRCEQTDGSVTWHLGDRGVRLLRGEKEIVVKRLSRMSRAAGSVGATS
jgi:DNA-binding IclR family transcriptional regulator